MSTTPPEGANPVPPEPGAPQTPPPGAPDVPPPPPGGYAQPGYPPQAPGGYAQPGYPPPPGYAPAPGAPAAFPQQPVSPGEERTWAIVGHLGFIVAGVIVPLIIFLIYKDRSAYLRHHASEALNFQITVLIASFVSGILVIVLIGILMLIAVLIGALVLGIMAAVAANKGEWYRYPLTLRLVK